MTRDGSGIARALDGALALGLPAQLQIAGFGTVSVYPQQDCYVTDIEDWQALYLAGATEVRVDASVWAAGPDAALPLTELRWRALCHDLHRALGDGAVPSPALVQLQSWPDLPRLPEELLAPVARICALLWRKPTVGYLVARTLGLPPGQVAVLLRALQAFGHVEVVGECAPRLELTDGAAAASAQAEPEAASVPSVVAKLWQRLMGLQPA